MSYNIAIVATAVPADDAQAWAQLESWQEAIGERHALLMQLYDRLTATYPCLTMLSDEEVDDGVWSDGPLLNNFGAQVAVLGILYSKVNEVLPFVKRCAQALGLTLFDWQTNEITRA